jgi:hypothetical protein
MMKTPGLVSLGRIIFLVLLSVGITAGCADLKIHKKPAAVPEIRPGILAGYLKPEMLPNSLALLPQPPSDGSAAFALDQAVNRQGRDLRGTPRWELAIKDAELMFPRAADTFACALILSEIAPDRSDAILARGRAFGESRTVCNVHWHSDVVAGRVMGAAAVARLHADPAFRAEVDAARTEVATRRAKGLKPAGNCPAESEALAGAGL